MANSALTTMERKDMNSADRRPCLVDELYAEAAEFLVRPRGCGTCEPGYTADDRETGAPPAEPSAAPVH